MQRIAVLQVALELTGELNLRSCRLQFRNRGRCWCDQYWQDVNASCKPNHSNGCVGRDENESSAFVQQTWEVSGGSG